ncbi:unnamed protein product [Trichobilharzia szidati]|nr:unnamed protein product [Trichobilharzia szidati]
MPRVVIIRQPVLAMIHRLIQLFILSYFIIYVMWLNRGYQSFDNPVSGVAAKVKGIAWKHVPKHQNHDTNGIIVLDSADYQVQPSPNSAFYLITRIKHSVIQNMTTCSEGDHLHDAECLEDYQCPGGYQADHQIYDSDRINEDEILVVSDESAHGIFTGKCLKDRGKCEIFGWCPTEDDYEHELRKERNVKRVLTQPINILEEYYGYFTDLEFLDAKNRINERTPHSADPFFEVINFTVLIKNSIEFPAFQTKRRNILPWMTKSYLNDCLYNPEHTIDQYCPKFRIGDIFKFAGSNANRMLKYGGVIAVTINWQCDLDWPIDYCLPQYEFLELESVQKPEKVNGKNKTYRQKDNHVRSSSSASNKTDIPEMTFDYSYMTRKLNGEDDFIDDEDEMTTLLEGFSMRITSYFGYDTEMVKNRKRILMHVNGVQFIIRVTGRAGKFNLLSFSMRLGSGLALLGISTIVTDLILFHFTNDRKHYKEITCDDKTLNRLLAIAAQTSLPESRRTQMMRKIHDSQLTQETDGVPNKKKRFKNIKYFKWGQKQSGGSVFPRNMNKSIKTPTATHISHPTSSVISTNTYSLPSSTTPTITNTDTITENDNTTTNNNNSGFTDNQIISDTTMTIESDTENGNTPYYDKDDYLNSKHKFSYVGGEQTV